MESPRHRIDTATETRRVDGVGRQKFDFHTGTLRRDARRRYGDLLPVVHSRVEIKKATAPKAARYLAYQPPRHRADATEASRVDGAGADVVDAAFG